MEEEEPVAEESGVEQVEVNRASVYINVTNKALMGIQSPLDVKPKKSRKKASSKGKSSGKKSGGQKDE